MTEKSGDFEKVMDMLRVQYGDAEIEIFNKELPASETVFSREQVEELLLKISAPPEDGELKLTRVILGRDFKPLVYEFMLLAAGERTNELAEEGGEVSYQYIVAGEHSKNIASLETVVFQYKTATDGTEMVYFPEIIAEFDKANSAWEVKSGLLKGSNDAVRRYAVSLLGLDIESGNEDIEVDEAVIMYLENFEIFEIESLVILPYDRSEIEDEIVFENEKMVVTLYVSEPDESSNTDRIHTLWLKV